MKRFLGKPLNLLFVLTIGFNALMITFLCVGILNSDKQSNNFENIQKVKKNLLSHSGVKTREILNRGFLKGGSKNIDLTLDILEKEIRTLPISSFPLAGDARKSVQRVRKELKGTNSIFQSLSNAHESNKSFYNLVNSNSWKNLTKVMRGANSKSSNLLKVKDPVELKRKTELLLKDFALTYRIANVSTLKQVEKEIIKKRSNELVEIYKSVSSEIDERIGKLSAVERMLKSTSLLIAEIDNIKGGRFLEANERSYLIKRVGLFTLIGNLLTVFLFLYFSKRNKTQLSEKKEKDFWDILKNYIFSNQPVLKNKEYSDSFISSLEESRSYFKKRTSFGKLFQETVPFGVIIFSSDRKSLWKNKLCNRFFNGTKIENYDELVSFFDISNLFKASKGFNLSVKKKNDWYTIKYSLVEIDGTEFGIAYIYDRLSLSEEVIENKDADQINQVEGILDNIINKNEPVSLDDFMKGDSVNLDCLLKKANRVNYLFEKNEESYGRHLEEIDCRQVDQVKLINDISLILKDELFLTENEFSNVQKGYMSLVSDKEKSEAVNEYIYKSFNNLMNKHEFVLQKIELFLSEIVEVLESGSYTKENIYSALRDISEVEILDSSAYREALDKVNKSDVFEGESKFASQLGELINRSKKLNEVATEVKTLIENDCDESKFATRLIRSTDVGQTSLMQDTH